MTAALYGAAEFAETVRAEWTVAGHLGVSYFLLLFDHASDAFRDSVGLGGDDGDARARGLVVAEAHLTYAREVRAGDRIRIRTRLLGVAPRKMHVFHEMRRDGEQAVVSTAELLLVHIDRTNGRAVEFAPEPLQRMQALVRRHDAVALPTQVGRAIQLAYRR
jgi:acyl-CoA thioester hydrolase